MEKQINNSDLIGFSGTENYYQEVFGLKITDGVKFVRDNCRCNWLISDIATLDRFEPKILKNRENGNRFLLVTLDINKDEKSAVLKIMEDIDTPIIYKQEYKYTDIYKYFTDKQIKFYLIDHILLLAGEY